MKIFLYIFKDYVKYVLTTLALCLFLFVLFDGIHRTGEYMQEYNPTADLMIKLYVYQFPGLITQSLPIASLIASVITMVLLSRTNEITAMRAAGMGPIKIGFPIAGGALLFSVLAFLIGDYVTPEAAKKMHYVKDVLIEKEKDTYLSKGARWARDGRRFVSFKDFDPVTRVLTEVRVLTLAENHFVPVASLDAKSAFYRPITGEWEFEGIKITNFDKNKNVSKVSYEKSRIMKLPIEPKILREERRNFSEMSRIELAERIDRGARAGANVINERVEFHTKVAFPFAAFVVSLIGIKFAYRSERSMETVKSILFALIIGMSYWLFLSAGKGLAKNGGFFPPLLGAWLANIVIFSYGAFDIIRLSRNKS